MPASLFTHEKAKFSLVETLRAAVSFRIPLWQAALGLIVAVFAYSFAHNLFFEYREKPTAAEPPRVRVVRMLPQPSVTSPAQTPTAPEEGFWKLPGRYVQMIALARKQMSHSPEVERNGI
jgi:hypothetical protein